VSLLGILLVAVAVSDLTRRPSLPSWLPLAGGPIAVAVLGLLAGLGSPADIALLVVTGLVAALWAITVGRTRRSGTGQLRPLLVLLGGAVLLILLAGAVTPAGGWLADWLRASPWQALSRLSADRFLIVVGLFGVQLSTGNELVRLVLAAVGAIRPHGQPQVSDQLRGGRLLGPMERLFILGLGLAGEITAAGLVVAAKGLIRFPELTARRAGTEVNGIGIDEVTEYFLLGSFVSWLIGLAALALTHLA
jgi:NADH:ubiquinone oxidoreductase subunit 6 (subunit J)